MLFRLIVCLSSLGLAVVASAADAPTPVKVNLSPAYKVGQKFHYTASMNYAMGQTKTRGDLGYPQKGFSQSFTGQLDADGEVLAVFPNGSPKKISFLVKSVSANTDVDDISGLPGVGSKITIEGGTSGFVLTIDDKPAVGQAGMALGKLVFTGNEKLPELAALSPKTPVVVGATWPASSLAFLAGLKGLDPSVDPKVHATSQMKLDSITGTGDGQTVAVSGQISIVSLPSTSGSDATETKYTYNLTVPAITTKGTFKEAYTASGKTTQVSAGTADSPQTEIVTTTESEKTVAISFQ